MAVTHVTDIVAQTVAKLRQQDKGKEKIERFLSIIAAPFQEIEDAAWQLFTQRGIDTAVGVQLDRIGKIIGQPRDGRTDEVYRRFLSARIVVNKSGGTVDEILRVAELVLDDEDVTLTLASGGPAQLLLKLEDAPVPIETATLLAVYFLRRTVAAGVRIVVEAGADPVSSWHVWGDDWDDPAKPMIGAYE